MAEVIHTRKGKYQYKYEHTREGDKVVSIYMYPVDGAGDRVKPYSERVAQQTEAERERVAQHIEIIVDKPATYEGVKVIEIKFDPIASNFDPKLPCYIVKKYKDKKTWSVYIKGQYTGGKDGYRTDNIYKGEDTLQNCKKYCITQLENYKG